jgi:hypothetical protein
MSVRLFFAALLLLSIGTAEAQVRSRSTKGLYRKLDTALARTVLDVDSGMPRAASVARLRNPLADAARVPVTIRVTDMAPVTAYLGRVGVTVANSMAGVIEAYVTPEHLRGLNSLPQVISVRQILPAQKKAVSQAVGVQNAISWHGAGIRGGGVKVGIIDDFDGFIALMGTELPASVTGRCYTVMGAHSADLAACDTGFDHGTAVAESLIDVAPDVQLFIANPVSRLDLRQTVDWMTSQGVRVINYSAAQSWDGPGDGTSPYPDSGLKTVDAAAAGNAVFVAAAGNEGVATYLGAFRDENGDGVAEFPQGLNDNAVFLDAGETIIIQLRWEDSWTAAAKDLDLFVYSAQGFEMEASQSSQNGAPGETPFELLSFTAPSQGTYFVAVERYDPEDAVPSWIQLQNLTSQEFEVYTAGSIGSPAETANPAALAVGAAPWSAPSTLEYFSSRGPTPDGRIKPDVIGVDGADTVTYGPNGFFGTSQATPHVAGLAALIFSAYPAASALDVANALKANARPGSGPRPSNDWGYGLVVLPNFCSYSLTPTSTSVGYAPAGLSVTVMTGTGCVWNAVSNSAFLTITSGQSGAGNGTVSYTIAANPLGSPRTGTLTIAGLTFSVAQRGRPIGTDFTGDGLADVSVFRPSTGVWYIRGLAAETWGGVGDAPVSGDFDGDGTADLAVFRPSNGGWYVRPSAGGFLQYVWGGGADLPVTGDYNGDGRTDVAVFRRSTGQWYIRLPSGGLLQYGWGGDADLPVQGDYTGDGITDVGVFRPSTGVWYIRGLAPFTWGGSIDTPVPGDYDGDGRTDIAVFRPSTGVWYIPGQAPITWGGSIDTPVPDDYDGDGKTDVAVFRRSTGVWYIRASRTNSLLTFSWSGGDDIPIARKPSPSF